MGRWMNLGSLVFPDCAQQDRSPWAGVGPPSAGGIGMAGGSQQGKGPGGAEAPPGQEWCQSWGVGEIPTLLPEGGG